MLQQSNFAAVPNVVTTNQIHALCYHPGHAATLQAVSKRRNIDCACISLFVACETVYYYVVKKNTNSM